MHRLRRWLATDPRGMVAVLVFWWSCFVHAGGMRFEESIPSWTVIPLRFLECLAPLLVTPTFIRRYRPRWRFALLRRLRNWAIADGRSPNAYERGYIAAVLGGALGPAFIALVTREPLKIPVFTACYVGVLLLIVVPFRVRGRKRVKRYRW